MKRKLKKENWIDLSKLKHDQKKSYEMSNSFYQGDVIDHKKFGLGFVQSTFANKIEVLFEDKTRTLVHKVMF